MSLKYPQFLFLKIIILNRVRFSPVTGSGKAKYTKGKTTKPKAKKLVPYSGQVGEEVTGGHGSDANQMDINGNEEELVQPNASYKVKDL